MARSIKEQVRIDAVKVKVDRVSPLASLNVGGGDDEVFEGDR